MTTHEGPGLATRGHTVTSPDADASVAAAQDIAAEFDVDGPRPAVQHAIAAFHRWKLNDAERQVLLALALDSYDGRTSAPTYAGLCRATGLYKDRVTKAVRSLRTPIPDVRPALIELTRREGERRTIFELVFVEAVIHRSGSPTGRAPRPVGPSNGSGKRSGTRSGSPTRTLPYPPMADLAGNGSGGAREREQAQSSTTERPIWPAAVNDT